MKHRSDTLGLAARAAVRFAPKPGAAGLVAQVAAKGKPAAKRKVARGFFSGDEKAVVGDGPGRYVYRHKRSVILTALAASLEEADALFLKHTGRPPTDSRISVTPPRS